MAPPRSGPFKGLTLSYSQIPIFGLLGYGSRTSRDPMDLSPMGFVVPMGTPKPIGGKSVAQRETTRGHPHLAPVVLSKRESFVYWKFHDFDILFSICLTENIIFGSRGT